MKFSEYLLMLAFLLLLLGAGNIYIGQKRASEYEKLLFEYNQEALTSQVSSAESGIDMAPLPSESPAPINKKNLQYLQARHGFYRFCALGGKCFLALAAIFMISSLVLRPMNEDS